MNIFVVEDNTDTVKYFRMYLEDAGHTVLQAGTVAGALAAIPGARCDLLISDIGLPDGDDWGLLRRLREEGLPHPGYAIAMSGYGMNADRLRSRAAGFRHHLLKPLDLDVMDALLDEAAREASAAGAPGAALISGDPA